MKKIVLSIIILLISGCSNQKVKIDNIQAINYNNINLLEKDFDQIKNELNKLDFKTDKITVKDSKNLNIISEKRVHNFKIFDNNIYYEEDNKYYISKNSGTLNNLLGDIEKRYTNFSFYQIDYGECNSSNNDFVIKLNKVNKCLIIDTNKILFNFKIHALDNTDNNLSEVDLLYQKEEISNNKIIIRFLVLSTPKIKISFDTEYNYTISILPTYNEETGKVEFNSSYTQKK